MTVKPCPDCVIRAGAMIVKARHACRSEDDAAKVKVRFGEVNWTEVRAAIDEAMLALKEFGVLQMEFGPGLLHLAEAQHGPAWKRYEHLLCAHNEFRKVLDRYSIANPTDKEIAGVIALGNWR